MNTIHVFTKKGFSVHSVHNAEANNAFESFRHRQGVVAVFWYASDASLVMSDYRV